MGTSSNNACKLRTEVKLDGEMIFRMISMILLFHTNREGKVQCWGPVFLSVLFNSICLIWPLILMLHLQEGRPMLPPWYHSWVQVSGRLHYGGFASALPTQPHSGDFHFSNCFLHFLTNLGRRQMRRTSPSAETIYEGSREKDEDEVMDGRVHGGGRMSGGKRRCGGQQTNLGFWIQHIIH